MIYEQSPLIYVERTSLQDSFATWEVFTVVLFSFRIDFMKRRKEPDAEYRTKAEMENNLREFYESYKNNINPNEENKATNNQ